MDVKSGTVAPPLRLSRVVDAPRPRVFAAWTKAEEMKRWMAPGDMRVALATSDLRAGGAYQIHMQSPKGLAYRVSGVYREVKPPERIVYTWRWEHERDSPEMLVTVEFRDRGDRTEIVLTHEGFPNEESRARHEHGWVGCLANLMPALHT